MRPTTKDNHGKYMEILGSWGQNIAMDGKDIVGRAHIALSSWKPKTECLPKNERVRMEYRRGEYREGENDKILIERRVHCPKRLMSKRNDNRIEPRSFLPEKVERTNRLHCTQQSVGIPEE